MPVRNSWSLLFLIFITASHVTLAKYHHIKLRHGRHRRQHGESYLPGSFVLDAEEPEGGTWGPWSTPSSCSRSCGGGVAHQTRQCLDVDDEGVDRCLGARRRFFSCNIQKCPDDGTDFRAQQCAEFDKVPFEGVYYDWIPYTGGPNKCELNCMPRGERFFYRHKLSVVDGTPCDVEKNDVCVEGKCRPVGCDMMLGSDAKEDACRDCGGDGSDCNTVNGLFDTDDLQVGYIDILLIPEGATNIVVNEVQPSNNYLAIRNTTGYYYLNGNWRIDFPRSLRFAGTLFHYSRNPQGFSAPDTITALGPTSEAIYIVLLYQDKNVGVHYEYSIPKKFSQQSDPDSYTWTADEYSTCSATCGGGYQSRKVSCVRRRDNEPVDENLCDPQLEPVDTRGCGEEPCLPNWVEGEWGPCSKQCGNGGQQSREIKCEQVLSGGIPSVVDDSQCLEKLGPKAEVVQGCNENVECPKWHLGPWKACDRLCGEGKQTRRVTCFKKSNGKIEILNDSACEDEPPEREKPCELRPCAGLDWVVSDWSGCDDKCGLTQETRTVHCATQNGTIYPDEKCNPKRKPESTKDCDNLQNCEFQWYTSQWSECSAKCGSGIQTRKVFCTTFSDDETLRKVPDSKCKPEKKYEDTQKCTAEVEECKGEWFAGPWSKCSKPCGGGDMTRKVICLKDNQTVPASNCDVDTIMFGKESCNEKACGEDEVIAVEPEGTIPLTDGDEEECEDYEDDDFVTFDPNLGTDLEAEDYATGVTEASPLSSPIDLDTTERALGTSLDDLMFSDSAYSRGDISPFAETGSGSGYGSGDGDFTLFSEFVTDIPFTIEDLSTLEGSGFSPDETGITNESESTDIDVSEVTATGENTTTIKTTESEGITDEFTEDSSLETSTTTDSAVSVSTEESTDSWSDLTDTESSEASVSGSTEDAFSTVTSELDVSEFTTFSSAVSTDFDETTASTESSESTQTDTAESTPTITSEETDSTLASSESESMSTTTELETTITDQTSTMSSSSSEIFESSESSTSSTDVSDVTLVEVKGEYNSGEETDGPETKMESTDSTTELEEGSSTAIGESTIASGSTSDGFFSTESSEWESTTLASIETTTFGETFETSELELSTSETTESGLSSESTTTEFDLSTISSDVTGSSETAESSTSEFNVTESSETTILFSEPDVTTETGISDEITESTDATSEVVDVTSKTHITEFWATISPLEVAITMEHKLKKCKLTKKKTCKTSEFGCCFDEITAAEGPFGKGCPMPQTCRETQFGCCPDEVSVASGPNGKDCPDSHCNETLFGCCPDGLTVAEGNDFEGCKKPCNETEFGCCPDNETPASGKDNLGCCNVTEHGCCPDGIKPASGPDGEGCKEEEKKEATTMISSTELEEIETTTVQMEETEDCANSTFGCCPDGKKIATGTNFEGCGVIDIENCTASYFGCCPDEISAALGPDYHGCHMPCENTTYGCCDDGTTPAHGPNKEGCCLTTPHKCCPDNILPARGPDFYGCGCQYSRFRCCPDNTTAARGPNNEGCGCQYTAHGCCPNRFTPASGPNFEGCPCYTYQFGCCPDGIAIAKGPHGQGCGCENTEFKCCSDGRTPAKGPNFAGCTCDSSKFGCCPDGIEEAQGENFEGCLTVPTIPGAACTLERDRGSCRDFSVKWFFDSEYGGCSRFWYGGCEGNENRFKTQEECKEVCVQPKGRDACFLPKITGPCEGYYPTWYYDAGRKQCGQFVYGGCLGNANKFASREECEELCVVPDDIDPCDQPNEPGPCQGNFTRWYFNKEAQACEQFKYGGCKANNNNYPTEIACHQQCLQPGRSRVIQDVCALEKELGPCPGSLLRWYFDAKHQTCRQFVYGGCKGNGNKFRTRAACEQRCPVRDSCSLPRAEGNCTEKHSRWYFDQSENRCMPFYYTGCGGNRNNFDSREACESDCPSKIEQDVCLLPALLGECRNYVQRWYHDSYEQRCRQFYYGGCGGNGNNFEHEQDCIDRCESTISTPQVPAVREFKTEFCFLSDDHGPCSENLVKWFYDSREGICKQFTYGGCQSNGNMFNTRDECEYRCGEVQDLCALPKIVGPCNGFVKQYYYDGRSDLCYEFDYSGCQGNRNRFQDKESCESKCKREPRVVVPPEADVLQQTTREPRISTEIIPSSPICMAPVDPGRCNGDVTAYYYDAHFHKCQAFIYGGCEGNANRFQTEEQCERLCGRFQGHDVCNLPVDNGPCHGAFSKYFYDSGTRGCREFTYGGCDGNANRFSTVSECESVCIHHEEPAPTGNDTALSHVAICREPVDIGSCSTGNYKRFYFDDERQTCMAFVYTGCGGNRNRFKTFESCINTCYRTSNEIDVSSEHGPKDPCAEAREECNIIRCPYGKEAFVDAQNCERCRCVDPCRTQVCPEGTKCAITLVATKDGTEYKGVCRSTTKPGRCLTVSNSTRCEQECITDADCTGEWKCCNNGCGTSCLEPVPEEPLTTAAPSFPVTVQQYGAESPVIQQPEEPIVSAEEGGFVTMKCVVTGTPRPTLSWRKDTSLISNSEKRRRILLDGSLQIINLYSYDRGTYICTADNGVGAPVRIEYQLDVTEPHERPAAIIGEQSTFVTVTMNSPTILHCYAMGWPRPFVTWWRGDRMLPLSSEVYEQDSDYTLLIRSVTLSNLGVYTCQAYNGIDRPASWSLILQAIGPVHNVKLEHQEYAKYLVQPPKKPEKPASEKPQYPYRPHRTQAPEYQTYAPLYPTAQPYVPGVIPITEPSPEIVPSKFKVPIKVNVSVSQSQFPEGSDISIGCNVDGYPIPRVLWYKDELLIQTNNRVKISEANRLIISDANKNDTGRYRCEASNEFTSDTDSVEIRVAGIFIHPNCQDNSFFANCNLIVMANYCQHKYYAKFCCRSCTEAGQLPVRGPHIDKTRRRRSSFSF